MPFEEKNGNVVMTLGYGEQVHPQNGERFFHHGIDLKTDKYLLKALADGSATRNGNRKETWHVSDNAVRELCGEIRPPVQLLCKAGTITDGRKAGRSKFGHATP